MERNSIKVRFVAEERPDFFSWLIMLATGRTLSHALVEKDGFVAHCIEQGVCVQSHGIAMKNCITVAEFEVPLTCTDQRFWQYVQRLKGRKYSYSQFLWMILGLRHFRNRSRAFVCSEFVACVLRDCCGMKLPMDQDKIKPGDLLDFLRVWKGLGRGLRS